MRRQTALRFPHSILAGVVAFSIALIVSRFRSTPYDNYVLLAQALAQGHVWITWPGPAIDAVLFHGSYYIIEGPLPGLLLVPFVAVFGTVNQTLLAVVLAGIAIGAAWALGERLGLSVASNAWICAFLFAGTDLLWCAMLGDVWFLAHVGAACFTMLALAELTGKRRGWLVAFFAACAFESRFSLVLALPVYAYLLGFRDRKAITSFVAVLVPVTFLWITYNEIRWGTWSDIGYSTWYHTDQVGMPTGSPFRLEYVPMQLWSFFVQGPEWTSTYPWLVPTLSGVALTWSSPALALALLARSPLQVVVPLWCAAVLTAAPNFLYYVNGFSQFGMRHALDFEPFLIALIMLAVRRGLPRWGMALIAYSVLSGFWGCWYWNTFVRATS